MPNVLTHNFPAVWTVSSGGEYLITDSYKHDVSLALTGTWNTYAERMAFATYIASKLNQPDSSQQETDLGLEVKDTLKEEMRQRAEQSRRLVFQMMANATREEGIRFLQTTPGLWDILVPIFKEVADDQSPNPLRSWLSLS